MIHLNIVRVLMGCSILDMLFNLDLSLLEVLFVYTIKKGKNDIYSFVASFPSLQLVTGLPDSTKGAATGHVMVEGAWTGSSVHPDKKFTPNRSLKHPGRERKGKLVEWVEKASFNRLNRMFEIASDERNWETLLSAQNLRSVTQEPQPYVLNILPRWLPKEVVAGEHFVLKDLPFFAEVREADAQARQTLLSDREERRQEGTLRKAPGDKRPASSPPAGAPAKKKKKKNLNKGKEIKLPTLEKEVIIPSVTYVKAVTIRTPDPPLLPSISSGSEHLACLHESGPSLAADARMVLLAEEATSACQPGSPHPDEDAAGAFCGETLPPSAPQTEETGPEDQGLPPCESSLIALAPVKRAPMKKAPAGRFQPTRDLKSGISGRLQDRLGEAIEVSCSSTQEVHSEESETVMVEGDPTDPVPVPVPKEGSLEEIQLEIYPAAIVEGPVLRDEPHHSVPSGGRSVDDATCTSASSFSYAELQEMLKQIPFGSEVALPPTKMFEAAETLVSGIRGMVRHRDLFSDLLWTTDHTKAFVSQRMSNEDELRSRLEQAEASLTAARRASEESVEALKKSQDNNEALRLELAEVKSQEEATDAHLHEAEDEATQLREEVRQLRTEATIEKKQREDLQLHLSAQKEELEAEFAAQMEELEADYQK